MLFCILRSGYQKSIWRETGYLATLTDEYRVVLFDPIGQGNSDAPVEREYYTFQSRMKHVLDLYRELNLEHAHFLGFGLGAQVGLMLALHVPKYVRSLTTIGGHPYPPAMGDFPHFSKQLERLRANLVTEVFARWPPIEGLSEEQKKMIHQGNAQALAMAFEMSSKWEGMANHFTAIQAPILFFTCTPNEFF